MTTQFINAVLGALFVNWFAFSPVVAVAEDEVTTSGAQIVFVASGPPRASFARACAPDDAAFDPLFASGRPIVALADLSPAPMPDWPGPRANATPRPRPDRAFCGHADGPLLVAPPDFGDVAPTSVRVSHEDLAALPPLGALLAAGSGPLAESLLQLIPPGQAVGGPLRGFAVAVSHPSVAREVLGDPDCERLSIRPL